MSHLPPKENISLELEVTGNEKGTTEASAESTRWKYVLSWVLGLVALGWVIHLLAASWSEFIPALRNMHPGWLLAAALLCLLGAVTKGETFYLCLEQLAPGAMPRGRAYQLQFIGQLARHLPGRFWGVAYQLIQTRGEVHPAQLILVHTLLAGIAAYFTLWAASVIFAAGSGFIPSTTAVILGLLVYWCAWSFARPLARFAPDIEGRGKVVRGIAYLLRASRQFTSGNVIALLVVSIVGWGLYLAAWAAFGEAYPGLDAYLGLRLAAYYGIAWLVGFIAIFTVSGLGVREIVFLALAQEFSPDVLAVSAVLGRLWLLVNDIVLGVGSLLGLRKRTA